MYRLTWCAANCANRKGFWRVFWRAIVARCDALLDNLDLAIEARSAALDQGHIGSQTHLVYMPPCVHVVQGIEDNVKASKPLDIEVGLFDVCMVCFDLDFGVESLRGLFSNLLVLLRQHYVDARTQYHIRGHLPMPSTS